jgi:hypothetical protein
VLCSQKPAHHRKPSLPTLEKLAKALRVKLSEIV